MVLWASLLYLCSLTKITFNLHSNITIRPGNWKGKSLILHLLFLLHYLLCYIIIRHCGGIKRHTRYGPRWLLSFRLFLSSYVFMLFRFFTCFYSLYFCILHFIFSSLLCYSPFISFILCFFLCLFFYIFYILSFLSSPNFTCYPIFSMFLLYSVLSLLIGFWTWWKTLCQDMVYNPPCVCACTPGI
jgi:hypothetical protein